ncbi:hypothetical protein ACWD4N_23950 [Streptomyces sp. NPDC002586]|uniref:hypothetical protein n=1 Tax=Streptomyces sp. CG1 TaxID=1287523 RepID=UPI0034E20DA4
MPGTEGLFHGAIVNSTSPGLSLGEADHAKRAAEGFLSRLGTNPRDAPVSDILGAQSTVAREAAGRLGLNSVHRSCRSRASARSRTARPGPTLSPAGHPAWTSPSASPNGRWSPSTP